MTTTIIIIIIIIIIITKHELIIGGHNSNGRGRLSSYVVVVCNTLRRACRRRHPRRLGDHAMTSCHLQSNYSSTITLNGGPVMLRPVRATPCFSSLLVSRYRQLHVKAKVTGMAKFRPTELRNHRTNFDEHTC